MKKLLAASGLVLLMSGAFAETKEQIERHVSNEVFQAAKKNDFVRMNRVTIEGELSSCELEFEYIYRDIRQHKGLPVFVTGSFSAIYDKGKFPAFTLKVNSAVMDMFGEARWKKIKPAFTNITLSGKNLKPYKTADFVCESGGMCSVFVDQTFKLNAYALETKHLEAEVSLSLAKGGMDHTFKLSSLGAPEVARKEIDAFQACNFEILERVLRDIDATPG